MAGIENQMPPDESLIPKNRDPKKQEEQPQASRTTSPAMRPPSPKPKALTPEQQKTLSQSQLSKNVIAIQSWRTKNLQARVNRSILKLTTISHPQLILNVMASFTRGQPLNSFSLQKRMQILNATEKEVLKRVANTAIASGIDPNDLSHPANLSRLQNMMSNPDTTVGQNFAALLGTEKAENDQMAATNTIQDQLTLQEQHSEEEEEAENISHFNFTKAEEAEIATHTLPRLEPKPGAQANDRALEEGEKEFTVDSAANNVTQLDETQKLELHTFKDYINHNKKGLMHSFKGEISKEAIKEAATSAVKVLAMGA